MRLTSPTSSVYFTLRVRVMGVFSWQFASPSSIIALSSVNMQLGGGEESSGDAEIFWGCKFWQSFGRLPLCFPVGKSSHIQILGQIKTSKNEFLRSMWADVYFTLDHYFLKEQPVFLNTCFPWQLLPHWESQQSKAGPRKSVTFTPKSLFHIAYTVPGRVSLFIPSTVGESLWRSPQEQLIQVSCGQFGKTHQNILQSRRIRHEKSCTSAQSQYTDKLPCINVSPHFRRRERKP